MSIKDHVLRRKIGAFELLLAIIAIELIFGSSSRVIAYGALSIGFYFAKKEFKGEFSLQDLFGLFSEKPAVKDGPK